MSKFKTYAFSILLPLIVGGLVGFLISGNMDYDTLKKPPLSPPGIVFPIVWTILYILMGISYAMLKAKNLHDTNTKLSYYVQLFINGFWSIFFFLAKARLFAFFWIILLLISIIIMIILFYKKDKIAGLLQLPYLAWTIFATYLNLFFYLLN